MKQLSRTRWIGRSRGHNVSGQWITGPVLVDVVTLDAGADYRRVYVLEIDGRHQFGGPADHLGPDGLPPAPFLTLDPDPERDEISENRPKPDLLMGCTCGGIGDTGSHSQGCPWSATARRAAGGRA